MTSKFTAACVQTNTGNDIDDNLAAVADLVRRAVDAGADLVALPETVTIMDADRKALKAKVVPEDGNPALLRFRELARETGAWLHVGSMIVDLPGSEKMANRGFLIDPGGGVCARYDKIHMFDVNLSETETHRESNAYEAGSSAVVATTPWCDYGIAICYDLRFAYLFRAQAQAGALALSAPSAFTRMSGDAHWHVLNRARAIETASFMLAPAQCGAHPGGRQTYGHSLIVDPWGRVLGDGGEEVGFVVAEIDPSLAEEARAKIPALTHDREITLERF